MTIQKELTAGKLVIAVIGRLDSVTAPDLDKVVNESLDGVNELVFDFKDLDYISSAGLRSVLTAQKIMNKKGEMSLINVKDSIREIFEMTGFIEFLNIKQ